MQKEYTTDERVAITQRIGEQMNECRKAHWKLLSAEGGPNVYDCERRNMNYIVERMAVYTSRINAHINRINIYNLSEEIGQIKAANRMARVWHAMTPYAMMDETLGKNLMDDLADVFENYRVTGSNRLHEGDYNHALVQAYAFIPGTCDIMDTERDQRFVGYQIKSRPDLADIFVSAVQHIAWTVDAIDINTI